MRWRDVTSMVLACTAGLAGCEKSEPAPGEVPAVGASVALNAAPQGAAMDLAPPAAEPAQPTDEALLADAKAQDTVEAYRAYLRRKPGGAGAAEASARVAELLESEAWRKAEEANTAPGYEEYLSNHPAGAHADAAHSALETIEWEEAISRESEAALRVFLAKYPESAHAAEAQDVLWSLKRPRVEVEKANSVTISSKGIELLAGEVVRRPAYETGRRASQPAGPNRVYIWRDFAPDEVENAQRLGLRPGMAFLRKDDGTFWLIRRVDLTKTDAQLCREFGVGE